MQKTSHPSVEMQIAPMIDVCFLLLFFYILTSKPSQREADLGLTLPGTVAQEESMEMPDEQRIQILGDGTLVLNEQVCASPEDQSLEKLVSILTRFKESTEAAKGTVLVTLEPADAAQHQRIIDALNACAASGIHGVTFGDAEEQE